MCRDPAIDEVHPKESVVSIDTPIEERDLPLSRRSSLASIDVDPNRCAILCAAFFDQ